MVVGDVLRQARQDRGLTLNDVRNRTRGRFKPSALGGYERGERSITLERFFALASLYEVPPDRLLARVCEALDPHGRREIVIDVTRLSEVDDEDHVIADLVFRLRTMRRDYAGNSLTLRSGDIEAAALGVGISAKRLLDRLSPIIRPDGSG